MKEWHELYSKDVQPSEAEIEAFLGDKAANLWKELMKRNEATWKAKTKLSFSVCSGKPGWNMKLQKRGKSLGTLYPELGSFSVFVVVPYSVDEAMQNALPELGKDLTRQYLEADDFMKIGKWMMLQIRNQKDLDAFCKICDLKLL